MSESVIERLHAEQAKLEPLADAIAQGVDDPEALHDLRVGLRRMRTIVRELGPLIEPCGRVVLEGALRELADVSSPVRDLDVLLAAFDGYRDALPARHRADTEPLRARLESQRLAAHRALQETLRERPLPSRPPRPALSEARLELLLEERAARLARRIRRHGRAAGPTSPAEAIHTLRKDVKRLRYLLEIFPEAFSKRARERTRRDLRGLQELLGAFQDLEVQRRLIWTASTEEAPTEPPRALIAVGMLLLDLERAQDDKQRKLPKVFARYDRRRGDD